MQECFKKLTELKLKLVTADDFYEVFNFFFDHFGESDEFIKVSVPQHNDLLQQVLVACAEPVLQQRIVSVHNALMLYVAEHQFYHGAAFFNQFMINFFYFEDIDAGLLAIATRKLIDNNSSMVIRFSFEMLGEQLKTIKN
jgi:hypothetical protein